MEILLTFLGCIAYLWAFVVMLKWSFLAIAPERHQISGLIFLMNNCLFVLPALLVVPLVGPLNIRILHYVEPNSVMMINTIVLSSMLGFVFCLGLLSHFFGRALFYDLKKIYAELHVPAVEARLLAFCRVMMLSIPVAIFINLTVFEGQHAFFSAAFFDLNPGAIRHINESSAFSAYTKHYFHVIALFMAPCLALPVYRDRWRERWLAVILVFAALTSHGSKSPFIFFLIFLTVAWLEKSALNAGKQSSGALFAPRRIVAAGLALAGVFTLFYFLVVSFFLSEGGVFWDYFWNRVFVGQMAGVYEQFNLWIYDPAFAWHSVPFASFFVDYPNFHKELMLTSENRVDPDSIGIKVTFFAAEAYGMFGWLGVIFAPLLMALQYIFTFLILNAVIRRTILRAPELSKYVTAFFFASYYSLTDGISEMVLYKGCVFVIILLSPVILCMALRGTWIARQKTHASVLPT
ncbi:MAG: hypothetical protein AAGL92_09935 [Pseudomonadota bacterium]